MALGRGYEELPYSIKIELSNSVCFIVLFCLFFFSALQYLPVFLDCITADLELIEFLTFEGFDCHTIVVQSGFIKYAEVTAS